MDDRRVINGIFYVLRTGSPWRDLPSRYGPPTTVCNRYNRWAKAGVWLRIFETLSAKSPHSLRSLSWRSQRAPCADEPALFRAAQFGLAVAMAKYDPLRRFLRRRRQDDVRLSFDEIERIIGGFLPKAAHDPAWWSNEPPGGGRGHVQRRAWLDAGYLAETSGLPNSVAFRSRVRVAESVPDATGSPLGAAK